MMSGTYNAGMLTTCRMHVLARGSHVLCLVVLAMLLVSTWVPASTAKCYKCEDACAYGVCLPPESEAVIPEKKLQESAAKIFKGFFESEENFNVQQWHVGRKAKYYDPPPLPIPPMDHSLLNFGQGRQKRQSGSRSSSSCCRTTFLYASPQEVTDLFGKKWSTVVINITTPVQAQFFNYGVCGRSVEGNSCACGTCQQTYAVQSVLVYDYQFNPPFSFKPVAWPDTCECQ